MTCSAMIRRITIFRRAWCCSPRRSSDAMTEGRFARMDFTSGEGQHKRTFATDGVPCVDLLLLRPTLANRLVLGALDRFDRAMALGKRAAAIPALRPLTQRLRRA